MNGNTGQGAVYVFVKPKGGWTNATETAKLTASDGAAGDYLGGPGLGSNAVGISGDTIVAGAPGFGRAGAVYVFVKPKGGWRSETQTAKLTASDGGGALGISVGIDGGTVVAGASDADGERQAGPGAAYVFVEPKGGWRSETEAAKLTASDGASGDDLGDLGGGRREHGRRRRDDEIGFSTPGAAYVFVRPRGGWRSETQTAKLTASDGAAGDWLGTGVAIRGDSIVAGAPFATVNGNQFQGPCTCSSSPAEDGRTRPRPPS